MGKMKTRNFGREMKQYRHLGWASCKNGRSNTEVRKEEVIRTIFPI